MSVDLTQMSDERLLITFANCLLAEHLNPKWFSVEISKEPLEGIRIARPPYTGASYSELRQEKCRRIAEELGLDCEELIESMESGFFEKDEGSKAEQQFNDWFAMADDKAKQVLTQAIEKALSQNLKIER